MTYTDGVLVFLGLSILFYLLFGGADFGAGILELFLGKKAEETIYKAIAPVWEANHMWLIIAIVILFNGFPGAYSLISTALHIPIMMVLIGIILRGTAFTFRHYDAVQDGSQRIYSIVFRYSSIFTVFSLGLVIAPLLGGTIPHNLEGSFQSYYLHPWLNGFSISLSLFLVTLSGYISAIYLLGELDSEEEYAKMKNTVSVLFISSMVSGIIVFIFSYIEQNDFQKLFFNHKLSLITVGLSVLFIPIMFFLIKLKRIWTMRFTVAIQMTLILLGMLFIHYPNISKFTDGSNLNIYDVAAPELVMKILFWSLLIGLMIIFPALFYLLKVFKIKGKQA